MFLSCGDFLTREEKCLPAKFRKGDALLYLVHKSPLPWSRQSIVCHDQIMVFGVPMLANP